MLRQHYLLLLLLICLRLNGNEYVIENQNIAWHSVIKEGKIQDVWIEDKLNREIIQLSADLFKLHLDNRTILTTSDFTLLSSRQGPGKQLVLHFAEPDGSLQAEWRVILINGSSYVRQELKLSASRDLFIKEIVLFNQSLPEAYVSGTVEGSPVVARNIFLGYEHPMALNTVSNGIVKCSFQRNAALVKGETLSQSLIIGTISEKQVRRSFLAYIEQERAHPYRPFLHYNSWFDIAWMDRQFNEVESLDVIQQFGEQLAKNRQVKLDSFLFDDGWDDRKTLWQFHAGFPNGFTKLKSAAETFDCGIGVWLSPFGGYEKTKIQRLETGKLFGYEINASGFSLAGPRYYQRFSSICMQMIQQYGVNQFKFDGLSASEKVNAEGSTRDGDAMMRLIANIREVNPDIYINQTTGTWPSPFWLLYVDSTWRGGDDFGFEGKGSFCQQWMTYRDARTYENVVQKSPLYPLNSLMLHGIIYAKNAERLDAMSDDDFQDQVFSFFGSGTQLQEMYITPANLNARNWDQLAEAANWSRQNADVLCDTHWIGGHPGKGEVYGWAAWSPRKSILVLRNPDDKPSEVIVFLKEALELPQRANCPLSFHSWNKDRVFLGLNPFTDSLKLSLNPFEVLILESD